MLLEGESVQDIAAEMGINVLTLRKAVSEGRLQRLEKKSLSGGKQQEQS
jgi:DNA-directed RNA polymerase specialized sigma24 family protein